MNKSEVKVLQDIKTVITWDELNRLCNSLGLKQHSSELRSFMPVESDEFKCHICNLLENGYRYYLLHTRDILKSEDTECYIKSQPWDDSIRPATDDDFMRLRSRAATEYQRLILEKEGEIA